MALEENDGPCPSPLAEKEALLWTPMTAGSSQVRSGFTTSYKKKGASTEGHTHICAKLKK